MTCREQHYGCKRWACNVKQGFHYQYINKQRTIIPPEKVGDVRLKCSDGYHMLLFPTPCRLYPRFLRTTQSLRTQCQC
jgi:hypothetical protein